MSDAWYYVLRTLLKPWAFRLVGRSNLGQVDPAIFVANHVGATGPLQSLAVLPVRLYPWVIAEMTDPDRIGAYLYQDFIGPTWHLTGKTGALVTALVGRIALPLIRAIDCVPVDRSRQLYLSAFRSSLDELRRGHNLLILPEDPAAPPDPASGIRPFMFGFIYLSVLYWRETGRSLPFYPLAVVPHKRVVALGGALYYDAAHHARAEILRMRDALQEAVTRLYLANGGTPP